MKIFKLALATPLALLASPLAANDADPDAEREAEAMAALSQMFVAEPLTPEQQARLPLAQALVEQIMPPGTMNEVMGGMFDNMLGPLMEMAATAGPSVNRMVGYSAQELGVSEATAAEIAAIVDPLWQERRTREMSLLQDAMAKVLTDMEPAMRMGMSEAYAVHFTRDELTDISAFFATESGATYARKSYALSSDPRIMSATMSQMPAMMGRLKQMEEDAKVIVAELGEKKTFDTLTGAEKRRLMELTGLSEAELRSGMEAAAAAEAAG